MTMIHKNTTLFDLTERYPETIRVLVEAGFRRMGDIELRRQFGSSVTVEAAAHARGLDPGEFTDRLRRAAGIVDDNGNGDAGYGDGGAPRDTSRDPVTIVGLVPCPVRVPMTNVLESAAAEFTAATGLAVEYNLQAAYTGTDWMETNLGASPVATDLPEIFLSAGFRLFFTDERFIRLRKENAFADRSGWNGLNTFAETNELADPEHRFSVIGVVPAVFMVNRTLVGNRPMPESWADILTPEFENSLALPVGDFDLFDALLLGIHRNFGMEGIRRLARNMYQEMHPAQMVAGASRAPGGAADRSNSATGGPNSEAGGPNSTARAGRAATGAGAPGAAAPGPAITIMPFFFTRTVKEDSPLVPVWPVDGALAAPILLVTRADRPEIQPLIDTITGLSISRVLSRLGLFPSAHPENDDFSAEEHPLQWPGWDLLLSPELPAILAETTGEFRAVVAERRGAAAKTGASV